MPADTAADLVLMGTILTVDECRPTAEALAVRGGRIAAVGDRDEMARWTGPDTEVIDVGDGCVLPGFVEAHGHPVMEAVVLSERMVDIRPVTLPDADAVVAAVRREAGARGADGAYLNGWDPLLQTGLPEPTLAWLDGIAPDSPLVIIHNSGHKAFFNTAAARNAGLGRDTPDPKGARYGRDAAGELDGSAEEIAAVFPLLGDVIDPAGYPDLLRAECVRLNRAGITLCSDMAFDPVFRPLLDGLRRRAHRPAAHLRDVHTGDGVRGVPGQRRRPAASGRHQDLGGRLALGRQHRPVLSVPGHRGHPQHRRAAGFLRACQLQPRAAAPRSSAPTSRSAGRWPATCTATRAST